MIQQDLFTARSMTFRHLTPRSVVCRGHCQLAAVFFATKPVQRPSGLGVDDCDSPVQVHGRTRYTLRYSGPLRWSRLHVLALGPFCISFVFSFYEPDEIYGWTVELRDLVGQSMFHLSLSLQGLEVHLCQANCLENNRYKMKYISFSRF